MTSKEVKIRLVKQSMELKRIRLELEALSPYAQLEEVLNEIEDCLFELNKVVSFHSLVERTDREFLEEEQRGRDAEVIDGINRGDM